jgi:hypothetical protein
MGAVLFLLWRASPLICDATKMMPDMSTVSEFVKTAATVSPDV